MPKIYFIIVGRDTKYIEAMVDFACLPAVVRIGQVSAWWENGEDVVRWFQSDLPRATRIVTNLSVGTFDDEALEFLTQLVSLWDSVFLMRENKDAFFCAMPERGGFIRSSPEGVMNMLDVTRNGLNPF